MKENTWALTGASGFVGQRLLASPELHHDHIFAISSHATTLKARAGITPVVCKWGETSAEQVARACSGAAVWVHAASRIDFQADPGPRIYQDNVLWPLDLFAHIEGATKIILLSSVSAMAPKDDPMGAPSTHYGMSKRVLECAAAHLLGERLCVLRLAGVWGQERSPKLFLNEAIRQARSGQDVTLKGGESRRNYLWSEDIALALKRVVREDISGIHTLSGPRAHSMGSMLERVTSRYGVGLIRTPAEREEPDQIYPCSSLFETTDFFTALETCA